jgi:pseudaminic acid cytidylyltransferase
MSAIAIIPARGGSKRIPGKNTRFFNGKPIIEYSIRAALDSGLFDEVMVSTDSQSIAEIAENLGAKVPFMRTTENADDHASTYDVISEVITDYNKMGKKFEYTCCIYPTAPFVTKEKLILANEALKDADTDAIFTVVEYSYPIQRSLILVDDKIKMKWEENLKARSQDLDKHYHDAGQFYLFKTEKYLESKSVFQLQAAPLVVSQLEAQDIDEESDWKLAELKHRLMMR